MQKRTWMVPVATLLLGVGIGTSGGSEAAASSDASKPTPAPTVTVTASAKSTVNRACVDALDKADKGLALAGEGFQYASEAMDAVSRFDPDGIAAATEKASGVSTKLMAVSGPFKAASALCREG